jgi:hypothetical protein
VFGAARFLNHKRAGVLRTGTIHAITVLVVLEHFRHTVPPSNIR